MIRKPLTRIRLFSTVTLMLAIVPMMAAPVAGQSAPPTSSLAAYPAQPKAPADAPNVLIIMTDDVGFAASSTFGGPINTPTFHAAKWPL